MANDFNKVVLVGRLVRDVEIKTVGNSAVANFSLANGRTYVSGGEKKEETNFIDCEAWGKLADIMKNYTAKGKQVLIEGRLKQQSWDMPDGKKASKIKVQVETMQLLGGDKNGQKQSGSDHGHTDMPPARDIPEEELGIGDIF